MGALAAIANEVMKSEDPKVLAELRKEQFSKDSVKMSEEFVQLLMSTEREGMENLIGFLRKSSFFDDPASAKYHNAFKGGLLDHSMNVLKVLEEKEKMYEFGIPKDSLIICALLHDLCKIGNYEAKPAWRKDKRGRWESYQGYGYTDDIFPVGHGEKSVFIISEFIKLSKVEIMAIRWHGGAYEDTNGYNFNKAVLLNPLIMLLHTADFEAATFLESQGTVEWLIAL